MACGLLCTEVPATDGYSCALCNLYARGDDECVKCPVYEKTGLSQCEKNMPYNDYCDHSYTRRIKSAQRAADKEIAFLESLL